LLTKTASLHPPQAAHRRFCPGGGTDLAVILGKEETIARVKAAIEKLSK